MIHVILCFSIFSYAKKTSVEESITHDKYHEGKYLKK